VQQGLELKGSLAVVGDDEGGDEVLGLEGDAVEQGVLVRPEGLDGLVDVVGGQAKVELDARGCALGGRLAQELPARVSCEAVLGQLGDGGVVRGAENLDESK
jgi:hypothetical protein